LVTIHQGFEWLPRCKGTITQNLCYRRLGGRSRDHLTAQYKWHYRALSFITLAITPDPRLGIESVCIGFKNVQRGDSTYPWASLSYLTSHRVSRFVLHVLHFHPVQVHFPIPIAAEVDKSIFLISLLLILNHCPAAPPTRRPRRCTAPTRTNWAIGTTREARRPRVPDLLS
jgi:hypothetical protein